jgi:hypothetical protein
MSLYFHSVKMTGLIMEQRTADFMARRPVDHLQVRPPLQSTSPRDSSRECRVCSSSFCLSSLPLIVLCLLRTTTGPLFPTAAQVAATPIPKLRTAGLSARKAEYILDLAQRFADGRLSTAKLLAADDEELAEMLTAVRGIGRWTGTFSPFTFEQGGKRRCRLVAA